jgi:DNA-directed RNA polymerase beta subunit
MALLSDIVAAPAPTPAVAGRGVLSGILREQAGLSKQHPAVREDELTRFDDYPAIRRQLFNSVERALAEAEPVRNDKYTLTLADVAYADPDTLSRAKHKEAVLQNKSLSRRLRGRWLLTDNATGEVVNKTNLKTLINVPYLTDHGTYVREGVEYTLPNQLRMRPGVYVRTTSDGYPEAQVNVRPGTGRSFRPYMDPETSVFHMKIGGRTVPMYPVLRAMEVSDDQLKAAWGEDIWRANRDAKVRAHALHWLKETEEAGRRRLTGALPVDTEQDEDPSPDEAQEKTDDTDTD